MEALLFEQTVRVALMHQFEFYILKQNSHFRQRLNFC